MTLAAFHAQISRALRRGTSLDDVIPDVTADAALFLEQNYTFRYMQKFGRVTVDPLAEAPERLEIDSQRIKCWEYVKAAWTCYSDTSEAYWDLSEGPARDMIGFGPGQPMAYYQDGDQVLVLDAVPTQSATFVLSWYEYTTWPTDDSATPRLLVIGPNVLKYQTLVMMAGELRDPRLVDTYTALRNEHLSAFLNAEEAGRDNNRKYRMGYAAP